MKKSLISFVFLCGFLILDGCIGIHEYDEPVVQPIIDPIDGSADIGTLFFHRVLAFEFTGTWCQHCPSMVIALDSAKLLRPGRIVEVAVHQYDEMSVPLSDTIVNHFSISTFPHVIFDFNDELGIQRHEVSLLTAQVDRALNRLACGIAIDASDIGSVTIQVHIVEAGEYRLCSLLVEDGVVARQAGYGDNYMNNSVLCSSITTAYEGDPLGVLQPGQEVVRSFPVPSEGNLRIVTFVLQRQDDGRWLSINAEQCALGNIQPYRYEPS